LILGKELNLTDREQARAAMSRAAI